MTSESRPISLSQAPAHLRHGSNIGQPLTRRDGVLKVTGEARYAADNHPPGMLHAVLAVSQHRARPRDLPRRGGGQEPSRRRRCHDARQPAAARRRPGRQDQSLHVPARCSCRTIEVRYANQPIAVVIAETLEAATEGAALLSPRYEALPARIGLDAGESFVPPAVGVGNPVRSATRRCRGGPRRGRRSASMRPTRRRRSITTRWSRTPSSRHGTAIRCRSIRRARAS